MLDLCCDSFHPFSIVDERAFKKFCRWIPGHQLPTRKTLSNSMIQEVYTKLSASIQVQLHEEVQTICLTADTWTSLKTESYIALTGHYLSQDLKLKTVLLTLQPRFSPWWRGMDCGTKLILWSQTTLPTL